MKKTTTFLFLFLSIVLRAQYSTNMRSDLPGSTLSPATLGRGMFQMQHNYALIDFMNNERYHLITNHLRYGITNSVELDVILDYGITNVIIDFAGRKSSGMMGEVVGFNIGPRFKLADLEKHNFAWSLLGTVSIKSMYEKISPIPDINVISSLAVPLRKGEIGISAGAYIYQYYIDIYSITLKYTHFFHPKFFMFLEDAVSFNSMNFLNYVNSGFGFYINPHFMFHLAGGFGWYQNKTLENSTLTPDNLFLETGLSWRIKTQKSKFN